MLIIDIMESLTLSEASTGYLQDAVADWTDRCKRRRVAACELGPTLTMTQEFQDLLHGFWDSNCLDNCTLGNLNCLFQDNGTTTLSDGDSSMPMTMKEISTLSKLQEEIITSFKDSMPNSDQDNKDSPGDSKSSHLPYSRDNGCEPQKMKKKKKKVVYPFAVVKPWGLEGNATTLADINKRILMRPTRPVKHPVGEFAIRPCVSADGPGLSGKAVVGLTRIHTHGRGTITIIRTRG